MILRPRRLSLLVPLLLSFGLWCSSPIRAADPLVMVTLGPASGNIALWARALLEETEMPAAVAAYMDEEIDLPGPLVIRFGGRDGPVYDPRRSEIRVPYGFLAAVRDRILTTAGDAEDEDVNGAALEVLEHALYHEFAHHLINVFRLPVAGREEDAADEIAFLLLIELYEEGSAIALTAADAFWMSDAETGHVPFGSGHSLDIRRFEAGICLIYGSDPDRYHALAREAGLTEAGRQQCRSDYRYKREAWLNLLGPHLKAGGRLRAAAEGIR